MAVSTEDKDAMARLLQIMEGNVPSPIALTENKNNFATGGGDEVILAGPGQTTQRDIQAMAEVIKKLNNAIGDVTKTMVQESQYDKNLKEALETTVTSNGIKIGMYQIIHNQDTSRAVNKQNFSVVNKLTGETIAHELGLYEAAHGLVKLLNSGNFINSAPVRELLESEASYTSHKLDAIRYKRAMKKALSEKNMIRYNLYEDRCQSSMDRAMSSKSIIKKIYKTL